MAKYLFTNIIGTFIFNEHYKILDHKVFTDSDDYENKIFEKELSKKHGATIPVGKVLAKIQDVFKDKKYHQDFHTNNLLYTKVLIKESINDDILIMQTINEMDDLKRAINMLGKRLREGYAWYNPEFENSIENHEKFLELILIKSKKELLQELKVDFSMGADFSKEDIQSFELLARQIQSLHELKEKEWTYLDKLMKRRCPNITAIAGPVIGAQLLEQAGSLRGLVLFPASTIQLLGAEKALFRHIKTGAKTPKYGYLREHPLVQEAKEKGRAARILADKIAIASKIDFFKGKFIGNELRKEVEKKIR